MRRDNYLQALQRLNELFPETPRRLLDVGCSNGWFITMAAEAMYESYGIEPDAFFYDQIAARASQVGVRVTPGFFPQDLPADWPSFEIISFNDVFEHLANPIGILRSVRQHLTERGVVVMALPMANGFVFKLARALNRLGAHGPLERMFQVHYPFPHLYYYSPHSLTALARAAGFEVVLMKPQRALSWRGSLHRARMDGERTVAGRLKQTVTGLALAAFAVVAPLLPSDNGLVILRPNRP